MPWVGSRYDTFLAEQIAIDALFAVSLNLLLGTTGLVSFGHVAYFGVGAYVCGILMKTYEVPFSSPSRRRGSAPRLFALVSGYFCVRLIKLYFAMLTLAFSQIVWAICYKWNDVTGGDQGLPEIPFPDLDWMSSIPVLGDLRISDQFYLFALAIIAISLAVLHRIVRSPFGRVLTTIRDNPERAAFIGVNVRAYQLAAFVVAGTFAGFAGALYGIFSRGVFADYVFWSKSAEVMIMTILGGMNFFWGPPVGALALVWLNQQITDLHRILAVRAGHDPAGAAVRASRAASSAASTRCGRGCRGRRACLRSPGSQIVRRLRRGLGRQPDRRDAADRRGDRPERRRQIDLVQPDHRASAAGYRHGRARRPRHHRRRAAPDLPHGDRPLVPAHQHLPAS